MLREIYRSNLILHGCKTYNLYTTWLVPRDSKVKRILSSDWLQARKDLSCPLEISRSTSFPVPWSQRFFLKFFLAKERARSEAATTSREASKSERKTFFSLFSPLRGSLLRKRRKISRKTSGTRVRSLFLHLLGNEPKNEVLFPLWSRKKTFSRPHNKSFVNRVCSVKVAGYCSLFFFLVFVHKNTETGLANRELKRRTSTGNDAFSL